MARHSVAKNGVCVHKITNTNKYLVFSCFTLLLQSSAFARPTSELEVGSGAGHDLGFGDVTNNFFASSWLGILVSLGFLVTLASLLALCGAGGCCGKIHWFGRTRQEEPLSFSNPMTEPGSTMMVPISQIDVRALEVDPIVFEPLPTVHDLTPITTKPGQGDIRVGHAGQRVPVVPIVPFSADDSAVYAHDWFEEPHNNFPRRNIEYVKEIGKGWFGQVIEAEARDIVPFAKKIRVIVKLLREDANGIEQMRFLDESRMYRDGDHGNILKLMGHSIEKLPFLLIMEYCPQGDLKSFLISNVIRAELLNSQGTIVKMALDVSKGLEWLHNAGFVHPDLAARNCQVGSENRVVIGDYGLGTQNFKDDYHWSSSVPIPLRWTAPETLHCTSSVIQILKVTETSNIWTLGVVIWEICEFGKLPYFELTDDEVISRVIIEKNYLLGRPTLPCMSVKDELYKVMSSCWEENLENRQRLYTVVRNLEELYNSFIASPKETNSNDPLSPTSPASHDEFDAKWEQLAGRGNNSEDDRRRKKNVSFLDLEKQMGQKLETEQTKQDPETGKEADTEQQKDQKDDLDEEQWTKKIERGDITQKVLEKSQSVQDLMVLTHFEQGDMGDFDSLLFVEKPSLQDQPQSSIVTSSSSEAASSYTRDSSSSTVNDSSSALSISTGGSGNESMLKKSCSEPAIDVISLANSSQTLTPGSVGGSNATLVPQNTQSPFTPQSSSKAAPPSINVITATPNPSVEINVIQPTPKHSVSEEMSSSCTSASNISASSTSVSQYDSSRSNNVNRKLHFKFDSSPTRTFAKTNELQPGEDKLRHRLTSTPLRSGSTPSPRVSDFEDGGGIEDDENVFETSAGYLMEGTFALSPIAQSYVSVDSSSDFDASRNGKGKPDLGFSILFGACDDHELGTYQGVKSQIHDHHENQSEEHKSTPQNASKTKQNMPRRNLFHNGDLDDSSEKSQDKKMENSSPSSQWEADSNISSLITGNNFSSSHKGKNGSITAENEEKSGVESSVTNESEEIEKEDAESVEEDHDEFWKMQLKSLQMAADSTRALFQTGLHEPATSTLDDRKFVEDIEADVEELGSLVLHDLEEPNSLQTIIKETRTREPLEPEVDVSAAKLAFEKSGNAVGGNERNDQFHTAFVGSPSLPSGSEVDVTMTSSSNVWNGVNNSMELWDKKNAEDSKLNASSIFDQVKPVGDNDFEAEDNDGEDVDGAEFVPSKWNQSLLPSRSAIKSPEQHTQPKPSGMKKSVSFEMKKKQLVYEYPPPPVPSDSEEEEQKVMLLGKASASLPFPLAASLDWELTQEELEDAEINNDDWEEVEDVQKAGDPMDVYRISGFNDDNFQVRCSSEPFVFSPNNAPSSSTSSTLGELRHTRDRLRLDLSRGEANFLDDDLSKSSSNPAKLDSGVGSSTNVSPFNTNCDILTKRSKNSD